MSESLVRKHRNPMYMAMLPSEDAGAAGGGGTGTDDGVDSTDGDGEESTEDSGDSKGRQYSEDDYNKVLSRMKAADKRSSELEQRVKDFENKDKSELDKANSLVEDLTKERDALKVTVNDLRIHNAFLMSNTYDWNNPQTALRLADLSNVTIGDDGEVSGLDDALKSLAASDPYLLKAKEKDGDSGDTPTGGPVGSGKKGDDKMDRKRLEDKYPALRR